MPAASSPFSFSPAGIFGKDSSAGRFYPVIEVSAAKGGLGVKSPLGLFDYHGRDKEEILRRRDGLHLKMCDFIEDLNGLKPA
ncbi:MAG: hypothetical protein JW765_08645 [Deltaproteobacteria bacterium]|nr:hypothetical protein [Candidatus Zymogenaceae bacterium]